MACTLENVWPWPAYSMHKASTLLARRGQAPLSCTCLSVPWPATGHRGEEEVRPGAHKSEAQFRPTLVLVGRVQNNTQCYTFHKAQNCAACSAQWLHIMHNKPRTMHNLRLNNATFCKVPYFRVVLNFWFFLLQTMHAMQILCIFIAQHNCWFCCAILFIKWKIHAQMHNMGFNGNFLLLAPNLQCFPWVYIASMFFHWLYWPSFPGADVGFHQFIMAVRAAGAGAAATSLDKTWLQNPPPLPLWSGRGGPAASW